MSFLHFLKKYSIITRSLNMKKLFSLLLALLMASSSAAMIYAADDAAASPAAETADRVLGDINNDGTVNIQDALDLYRYTMLPESYTIDYPGILDFVMDDSIDIADAVMLFQYSMLPETFPIVWGNESEYPIEHLSINGVDISEYVITTNGSTSSTVAYAASELQK